MQNATSTSIPDWWEMAWIHRARCASEDPDLFFPVGSTGPFLEQIGRAKAVCRLCPVRAECLEWALATDQDAGIWGGLTVDERRDREGRRQEIAAP